mmetsp:Transcript_34454/g.75396  ORF Transcript_34454/g.75396 Transcript_34454/m.75396 type:complete len:336 (+) Transcript_34454:3-1010(+)
MTGSRPRLGRAMGACQSCFAGLGREAPAVQNTKLGGNSTQGYTWHGGIPVMVTHGDTNLGGLPGYIGLVERKSVDVGLKEPLKYEEWSAFRIGSTLWPSGALLARALAAGAVKGVDVVGKRCAEVGAGVGLPGLAAGVLGAREVVLTDRNDLVELMEKCIESNGLSGNVKAAELDWAVTENQTSSSLGLGEEPFDYVFGADVVYMEEQEPLLDCLRALMTANTVLVLAYRERTYSDREYLNSRILPRLTGVERVLYEYDDSRCEIYTGKINRGSTMEVPKFAPWAKVFANPKTTMLEDLKAQKAKEAAQKAKEQAEPAQIRTAQPSVTEMHFWGR